MRFDAQLNVRGMQHHTPPNFVLRCVFISCYFYCLWFDFSVFFPQLIMHTSAPEPMRRIPHTVSMGKVRFSPLPLWILPPIGAVRCPPSLRPMPCFAPPAVGLVHSTGHGRGFPDRHHRRQTRLRNYREGYDPLRCPMPNQ